MSFELLTTVILYDIAASILCLHFAAPLYYDLSNALDSGPIQNFAKCHWLFLDSGPIPVCTKPVVKENLPIKMHHILYRPANFFKQLIMSCKKGCLIFLS